MISKYYKIDAVIYILNRRFGNAAFFRVQNYTVKKLVKFARIPEFIIARVRASHVAACASAQASEKKKSNLRKTKVLIKATRTNSSKFENQPHLLLFQVFLVGWACLQNRNLQCMILLVKMGGHRKVISPVDDMSTVLPEPVRQHTTSFPDIDCQWKFGAC